MLESEIARYISPERRARIFEEVLQFSTLDDFRKWRNELMPSSQYPELPRELWNRVPLVVPVGDGGFRRVEPNELVISAHRDEAVPDLIKADYVSMTDEELHIYADYISRYTTYLEDLRVETMARIREMKQRSKEARDLLQLAYNDEVSTQSQRKSLASTDPFVRELAREIQADETRREQLEARGKKLTERLGLISRDLTRRHKEYDVDRSSQYGAAAAVPRDRVRTPPRGRRTRRN